MMARSRNPRPSGRGGSQRESFDVPLERVADPQAAAVIVPELLHRRTSASDWCGNTQVELRKPSANELQLTIR